MSNSDHNSMEDCKDLIQFLDEAEKIIRILINDDGKYILVRFARDDSQFRDLLKIAWREATLNLDKVRDKLSKFASSDDTDENEIKSELIKRGLTGNQLQFKLYVFERLKSTFFKTKSAIAMRRIIRHIDVLLKSLSGPFTGIDAVGEIKEVLEGLLKK